MSIFNKEKNHNQTFKRCYIGLDIRKIYGIYISYHLSVLSANFNYEKIQDQTTI